MCKRAWIKSNNFNSSRVKCCPFSTNQDFGSRQDPSNIGLSYDDPTDL